MIASSVPFIYTIEQSLSTIIMKYQKYIILMAINIMAIVISSTVWISQSGISVFAQNTTGIQNITGTQNITGMPPNGNNLNQTSTKNMNDRPLSLIIDHSGGGFTSLQTDADNTTWITTGDWELVSEPSNDTQSNSSVVNFSATVGMRGTDNSDGHEHKISEFRLTNSSIASDEGGSEIIFNGTATIETDVGLYSDVPISIKIDDDGPVIVSIDTQTNQIKPQWIPRGGTIGVLIDERVQDHFGNTPVYGDIKKER